ncbi:MAG: hypothetical protein KBF82_10930 [Chitinophagaceae bacterium]|nr:hypothetical protein [Chitinophagaceae bacterium]
MKKYFFYWLALCVIIVVGCQKELSFEGPNTPAEGSLQADITGDCLPKTVNGVYEAGKPLVADSNTISIEVNVLTTGTYEISTDTVNGYFFRATGIFTTPGINTVKLRGNGTPFVSLTNNFVVTFDSTVCDVQVQVLPAGAGGPAGFTIQSAGTPANCSGATSAGTYIIGTPLNGTNTVTLSVNVTTIGTYNVSTIAQDGMTFSKSGAFLATGVQALVLTGSGTPTGTPGAVTIPITAGSSTCNFGVTTVAGAVFSIDCASAIVNGTYQAGTAVTAANTVDITVNVATAGPYNISTTATNGMTFTASGTFAGTGPVPITLTGSGTPLAAATSNIPVPGTAPCTFDVIVVAGGGGSGNFLRCKIDGVLTNFNTSLVGFYVPPPGAGIPYSITVKGINSGTPGSVEEFWVVISNPTAPTTGVYNNRTFSTGVTDRASQITFYPTGFPNLYWGSSAFNANTASVTINTVNTTSASGIFSGLIHDNNGGGSTTKLVTEGEFQITF